MKEGNDLIFQVGSGGDSVRVKNWFADKAYWIERVIFADGSEWSAQQLTDQGLKLSAGSDIYNTVIGMAARDVHGLEGNDTLNGGSLADSLYGDAGQIY